MKGLRFISVFLLIIFVIAIGFILLEKNKSVSIPQSFIQQVFKPIATPFKFQELTIPYLRNRKYESKLGNLEKYSENASYTSYLTSYDSDGLKINGLLTKPTGKMPDGGWPAIVFVHGYIDPTIYKTTQNYVAYVDYLARNGFVVFKIDLRGHDKSEGQASGAYYSSHYVIDTLNAREALKVSDFVNPNKVGLWGHSMAGNITFRSFAVMPDIPALVIWAGAGYTYSDLTLYRITDLSYHSPEINSIRAKQRQDLKDTYGDFDPNSEFWKQVAPTNYISDLKGAIEIHHAIDDNVVSIEYSRNLMKLLDNVSIDHKLYEYQTGGHNISGASFNTAMQRTVDFFNRYLKI